MLSISIALTVPVNEDIVSAFSYLALARAGSCANATGRAECAVLDQCLVPLSVSAQAVGQMSETGAFVYCLSTSGSNGTFVEQLVPSLFVFASATASSISA
eukprot:2298879-Rhodomonas_salina.1